MSAKNKIRIKLNQEKSNLLHQDLPGSNINEYIDKDGWIYFESMLDCGAYFGISSSNITHFIKHKDTDPTGSKNKVYTSTKNNVKLDIIDIQKCQQSEYNKFYDYFFKIMSKYTDKTKEEILSLYNNDMYR